MRLDHSISTNLFHTQLTLALNFQICLRNGKLCLVFRIADRSGKHLIRTKISAYMIKQRFTSEGACLHHYMVPLKLNKVEVFIWPTDVVHEITETSPFWQVSANDLMALEYVSLFVD